MSVNSSSQQQQEDDDDESHAVFVLYSDSSPPNQNLRASITHLRLDPSAYMLQEGSFQNCTALVSVDLAGSSLEFIERCAFVGCTSLQEMVLPSTVKRIEESAFAWCGSLVTVSLFDESRLEYIGRRAFVGTILQSIAIPSSVEIINDEAFDGCHLLTRVQFSDHGNLVTIGSRAFASCSRLTAITIPSTVKTLGSSALAWCKSLVNVQLPKDLQHISDNLLERCLALRRITLPDTVETIASRSFEYCTALVHVDLPSRNLKSIGYRAFADCTCLQNLVGLESCASLISIGEAAFAECRLLTNVHLPQHFQLTWIGGFAFAECQSLRAIAIPNTVREISTGTFQGCVGLVEVELSEGLEAILDRAFAHCQSLSAISFPQSLYMIGRAFYGCTNLLGVEIPKQADLIMTFRPPCFSACSSLVTVSIPSLMDESMVQAFSDCERLKKNDGDLPLQKRFRNLPVHDACYHASQSTLDELREAFYAMAIDGDDSLMMVDAYGMTPCHIVATGTKLCLDTFRIVLGRCPPDMLWIRDIHDQTAMDYLLVHRSSRAIPLIQLALQKAIGIRMKKWGLDSWKLDLSSQVKQVNAEDIENRQEQFAEILGRLENYREMEATSIVELALWKMAMSCSEVAHVEGYIRLDEQANYRLRCGADVVMPNVMEFLWKNGTSEAVYWI